MKDILPALKSTIKSGNEKITFNDNETNYSLLDFWRWSASDLLSNATRGRFAEFLVGTKLDLELQKVRDEWDAYDLISNDGIKIEVKSAAYILSWEQRKYSSISFSIKAGQVWNSAINKRTEARRSADIYIFCLLKHKDQTTINPLMAEQWEFYVVPTFRLNNYSRSQSSITLKSLQKLTNPIQYNSLRDEIKKAYKWQSDLLKI